MTARIPLSSKFIPGDRVINTNQNSEYYNKVGTVKDVQPDNRYNWECFGVCYTPLIAIIELDTGKTIKQAEKYWYKFKK